MRSSTLCSNSAFRRYSASSACLRCSSSLLSLIGSLQFGGPLRDATFEIRVERHQRLLGFGVFLLQTPLFQCLTNRFSQSAQPIFHQIVVRAAPQQPDGFFLADSLRDDDKWNMEATSMHMLQRFPRAELR